MSQKPSSPAGTAENRSIQAASAPNTDTPKTTELQKKLASQIIHWLKSEHAKAGFRLKETELAKRFGVSRTPVRAALQYLQQQHIVLSLPYRGFELQQDSAQIQDPDDQPESTPDDDPIYMALLLDIFVGSLQGLFSESDLQQKYNISRYRCQNLIRQLEADQIIEKGAGYKWQINQALNSLQHHYESYRCRLIFEPAALREPQWQLNLPQVKALQTRHIQAIKAPETINAATLFQLSADFHETLVACSGNRFLLSMMQQQNRLRKATDILSMHLKSSIEKSCRRRLSILEHLLNGHNDQAADELTALLENDIRVMQNSYQEIHALPVEKLRQWLEENVYSEQR